ncbi:RIP metalloprotease RseP [Uliginosibacterium gangwonense]|uniref:RIP metalloprotease RseP n=1 Tax=Uliginosibacterium gangwonense TaxID=392736 RepID=UPI00036B125A|nr:RIP metalloprotease RseP [Uliginosibacterium gangwonense]
MLLQYILAFVVAIAILVTVHELGHFLVARLCGVKVLRFSLGFGRIVKSWRIGPDQTEWAISAIPLGGYVKMLGESDGDEVPEADRGRAFHTQVLYKRSLIVLAGPFANLLLAAVIYWGFACVGTQDLPAVVSDVTPQSAFAQAGVQPGDRIVEVSGQSVRGWSDFKMQVVDQAVGGQTAILSVDRGGVPVGGLRLDTSAVVLDETAPDPLSQLGAGSLALDFNIPAVIDSFQDKSPAAQAGLKAGDEILSVDGRKISNLAVLVRIVSASAGKTLQVNALRQGQQYAFAVHPLQDSKSKQFMLGVKCKPDPDAFQAAYSRAAIEVRYGLADGLVYGVRQTWDMSLFSLKAMWRIVTGHISMRNVSGPVTIADYAGKSASAGLGAYLQFLALISVSIGVLNLLPIPILDGGHLLYHAAEFVRGKPLPERIEEYGQRVGMALLAGMMALAFFNDFNRFFFG